MGDPSGAISVRQLNDDDSEGACAVINVAARWYKEFLPAGEYHDPEMTVEEWSAEAGRLTWFGAFATGKLVGVMGLEYRKGVALLRHAYVLVEHQQEGIGSLLREHLEGIVEGTRRIIVGTYEGNYKARRMLEAAEYSLSKDSQTVLQTYYDVSGDRARGSVTYEKLIN